MRRVISSAWTLPFKVVVPFILLTISSFLILTLFRYASLPPLDALIGVFFTVLATVFFCWWGVKLKYASVDDQSLSISNLTREISIPLIDIDSVDDFQGGVPVRVRLKTKSEFGPTILFIARFQAFSFHKTHPIVAELRSMVEASKGS